MGEGPRVDGNGGLEKQTVSPEERLDQLADQLRTLWYGNGQGNEHGPRRYGEPVPERSSQARGDAVLRGPWGAKNADERRNGRLKKRRPSLKIVLPDDFVAPMALDAEARARGRSATFPMYPPEKDPNRPPDPMEEQLLLEVAQQAEALAAEAAAGEIAVGGEGGPSTESDTFDVAGELFDEATALPPEPAPVVAAPVAPPAPVAAPAPPPAIAEVAPSEPTPPALDPEPEQHMPPPIPVYNDRVLVLRAPRAKNRLIVSRSGRHRYAPPQAIAPVSGPAPAPPPVAPPAPSGPPASSAVAPTAPTAAMPAPRPVAPAAPTPGAVAGPTPSSASGVMGAVSPATPSGPGAHTMARLRLLPRRAAAILTTSHEVPPGTVARLDADFLRAGSRGVFPFPLDPRGRMRTAFERVLDFTRPAQPAVGASVLNEETLTAVALDLARVAVDLTGGPSDVEGPSPETVAVQALLRRAGESLLGLGTATRHALAERAPEMLGGAGQPLASLLRQRGRLDDEESYP